MITALKTTNIPNLRWSNMNYSLLCGLLAVIEYLGGGGGGVVFYFFGQGAPDP